MQQHLRLRALCVLRCAPLNGNNETRVMWNARTVHAMGDLQPAQKQAQARSPSKQLTPRTARLGDGPTLAPRQQAPAPQLSPAKPELAPPHEAHRLLHRDSSGVLSGAYCHIVLQPCMWLWHMCL